MIHERIPKDENGFPLYRATRREAVDDDAAEPLDNSELERHCRDGLIAAVKLDALMRGPGADQIPDPLKVVAGHLIEVAPGAFRAALEASDIEQPVIVAVQTESRHYAPDLVGLPPAAASF